MLCKETLEWKLSKKEIECSFYLREYVTRKCLLTEIGTLLVDSKNKIPWEKKREIKWPNVSLLTHHLSFVLTARAYLPGEWKCVNKNVTRHG
jgi:hypothetical protein